MEEKGNVLSQLDEVIESISMDERVVVKGNMNGHTGQRNRGDEEVMGNYIQDRNMKKPGRVQRCDSELARGG